MGSGDSCGNLAPVSPESMFYEYVTGGMGDTDLLEGVLGEPREPRVPGIAGI